MQNSKIEWCDHTINFWHGCTKVSPGCANCYAEGLSRRFGKDIWGQGAPREDHRKGAEKLAAKLNRQAEKKGVRYRVFCNSMSDWLDEEVPIEWLADMLDMIRTTPNLDWLLLTKRPENWGFRLNQVGWSLDDKPDADNRSNELRNWLGEWLFSHRPPANVWIGTTVEDQKRAYDRIVQLLEIPAEVRFLSCEPMLGPVDLSAFMGRSVSIDDQVAVHNFGIHWVIAGGESGPKARPMYPDWALALRDQCQAASVPFFMKQMGGPRKPFTPIPDDLFIREFPTAAKP